jgi:hypothetical protein
MTTDNRRHTACTVAISAVVLLALLLMWSAQIAAREIGPESSLCAEMATVQAVWRRLSVVITVHYT